MTAPVAGLPTPAEPILLRGVAGYLRNIGRPGMAELVDDAVAVLEPHMLPGGSVPAIAAANRAPAYDEVVSALRIGREVLAAVIGDMEDGFSIDSLRAKYLNTLLGARDGMDDALTAAKSVGAGE